MVELQNRYGQFWQAVDSRRREQKWNIRDFAQLSDVSANTYYRIKNATHRPTRDVRINLINALNLPTEEERRLFALAQLTPPLIPTSPGTRINTMVSGVGLTLEEEQPFTSELMPHALRIAQQKKASRSA